MAERVLALTPKSRGRWLVETESGSLHIFDLDKRTYQRRPRAGARRLDCDKSPCEILEIEHWPTVNSPFGIWVAHPKKRDYEISFNSTYVLQIVKVPPGDDARLEPQTWTAAVAQAPPINAWLLIGDEASFPTQQELAAQRSGRMSDLLLWTAPRQAQRGDLMLIYFMDPRKAIHFAARALYPPIFDPNIEVNALKRVDPHQWWTRLTPLVETPAISYSTLRKLHDGHLILKGKPSNYLTPRVVDALLAMMGDLDDEARLVLKRPTGSPELPDPGKVTFRQWRAMADGPLRLEALVEQYVVEPLLRLCLSGDERLTWRKAVRIPGAGVADYGVFLGSKLLCVIEVKIGIRLMPNLDFSESPDFAQVLRYASAADVPALLIDSSKVLLIDQAARAPRMWIDRHTATEDDLKAIRAHVGGAK